MYCSICNKHRKFKKTKISYIFLKVFLLFIVNMAMNIKKIFREEESIETSKIFDFINNIEQYQKTYNHA